MEIKLSWAQARAFTQLMETNGTGFLLAHPEYAEPLSQLQAEARKATEAGAQWIVAQAKALARRRHQGQVRKYNKAQPYFTHLERVALLVRQLPGSTPEMVAAAYLHDVLEDTVKDHADRQALETAIEKRMGRLVLSYVLGLTNPSKGTALSRDERKAMDRQHLKAQPEAVRKVKLADLFDNLSETLYDSVFGWATDYKFQRMYLDESASLLQAIEADLPEQAKLVHDVIKLLRVRLNLLEA